MAQQHQVAIADDGGEHIVEIMRHAAGQLPNRLHLGRLRHLPPEARFLAGVRQAEQHRRFAKAPHPGKPKADRLVRLAAQAHRDIAAAGGALPETTHRIGHRRLVARDHQVGWVRRQGTPLQTRRTNESRIGEQEMPVAVGHGEAQRQLFKQRFQLGRLTTLLARQPAKRGSRVEQQHQHRFLSCRIAAGRIFLRIGQRHVDQRLRGTFAPFAGKEDAVAFIGEQQRGKIHAHHAGTFIPAAAPGKGGIDRAHRAVGPHQRRRDSRRAEHPAKGAGHLLGDGNQRFVPQDRSKAPDEIFVRPPAAHCFGCPRTVFGGQRGDFAAVAITPGHPRQARQQFSRRGIHRQARRRKGGAEPAFKSGIGADKPVRPVGYRHSHARLFDRGNGHRPVGRRLFDLCGWRGLKARGGKGDQAQHGQPAGKGQRDNRITTHQQNRRNAGQHSGGNRQRIGQRTGTLRNLRAAHPAALS